MQLARGSALASISGLLSLTMMMGSIAPCTWSQHQPVAHRKGRGVSSCFSEGAFPDPTPSFSPPPDKPQATSHVPVCPLTLGSALVPPYLCLPIFPATTSAATEPHLSSGRFLVWPAGRLPAPQTDVSPSLTPTHCLPAGPHPFPAPTAGSREVQGSNPRY